MASGRPLKRASLALLLCVGLATLCLGCGSGSSAFSGYRRQLDVALKILDAKPDRDRIFAQAMKVARTPAEWLSLLSRARQARYLGDEGRYEAVASKAVAMEPKSRDVARAAADAWLSAGKPEKVLELFQERLSAEDEPGLWALAVVLAARRSLLPPALERPATFERLATILHEPHFYVDAGLLSLESGDFLGASSWFRSALAAGVALPPELMWDAGLVQALATKEDAGAGSRELRLMGDASWMEGDIAKAALRWTRAIKLDPRGSWRSYASLAALAGEGRAKAEGYTDLSFLSIGKKGAAMPVGRNVQEAPPSAIGDPVPMKGYAAMIAAFPGASGARTAYAAALVRAGRKAEAATWLAVPESERASAPARDLVSRLTVGADIWPEKRLVSEAIRLVNERPGDGDAFSAVMDILLGREDHADFLVLEGSREGAGLSWPRKDFHAACAALLRGDLAKAEECFGIARAGGGDGPYALFALGILAEGRGGEAARVDMEEALAKATTPRERCAIYKELGRIAASRGDGTRARDAWKAASLADPQDAEAASMARR